MARTPRYTTEEVVSALEASWGVCRGAAEILKCDRNTVTRYIKRSKAVRAAHLRLSEDLLDLAELKLVQKVKRGDGPMIRFLLQTKGRHRGWARTVQAELSGVGGRPIEASVHHAIEPDDVDRIAGVLCVLAASGVIPEPRGQGEGGPDADAQGLTLLGSAG